MLTKITSLSSLLLAGSIIYGLNGYNIPKEATTFQDLLKAPNQCTDKEHCPAGAYFVNTGDGAELLSLGTTIGGAQDDFENKNAVVHQWSDNRYAILVPTGTYNMASPFKINYYTQVLGVGPNKSAVTIAPGINALNQCFTATSGPDAGKKNCMKLGGLNNFWRGIEDVTLNAADLKDPNGQPAVDLRFAISQAAPIRNMDVTGKPVLLCDYWTPNNDYSCGFASGGFLRGSDIPQGVSAGSQQQYYFADSTFKHWESGMWNMVSVNNTGDDTFPDKPDTTIRNKWEGAPFTNIKDEAVKAVPHKPRLELNNGTWSVDNNGEKLNVDNQFYVINNTAAVTEIKASSINAALKEGKNLLFMPGMYKVDGTIDIANKDTVVLGLGIATLIGDNSNQPIVDIQAEQGVHFAGLTLQAGDGDSSNPNNTLLKVGDSKNAVDNITNPVVLQDVFCRIANTHYNNQSNPSSAYSCVTINTNNVIGEDLWLWRADHDAESEAKGDPSDPTSQKNLTTWNDDKSQYGIIINGGNVTMLGLAVEHFQNFQTVWNGKKGKLYFYQSEMPYNVPTMKDYPCTLPEGISGDLPENAKTSCASLVITPQATGFDGKGLGVYSYFVNKDINPEAAILTLNSDITMQHIIGRWLNGGEVDGVEDLSSYIKGLVEDSAGKVVGEAAQPTADKKELGSALKQYPQ